MLHGADFIYNLLLIENIKKKEMISLTISFICMDAISFFKQARRRFAPACSANPQGARL